jgi:hypothetical protein
VYVFLGILDPALQELFGMSTRNARLRLEQDLVLSALFTSGIKMPDVFLFNNPALHQHVLTGRRQRSLFSELLNQNVVQVIARTEAVSEFQPMLMAVKEDTLSGVSLPIKQAVAIQETAGRVAERLSDVSDRQNPGHLPRADTTSVGETLAEALEKRSAELVRSGDRTYHKVGEHLGRISNIARRHLSRIPGAGVRRVAIVTEIARRLSGSLLEDPQFYFTPYKVILEGTAAWADRGLLRRQMLELAYLYQTNLARRYGTSLYWPRLYGPNIYWPQDYLAAKYPDLARAASARVSDLFREQTLWYEVSVQLPQLRVLRSLGGDLVALREGQNAQNYFWDLQKLRQGKSIGTDQVTEDLHAYAAEIRRAVRSQAGNQKYTLVSGLLSAGGAFNPMVGGLSGLADIISVIAPGQTRQKIAIYRIRTAALFGESNHEHGPLSS